MKNKYIEVDIMYRDACNYKTNDSFTLVNNTELDAEGLTEIFKQAHLFDEPIMVQDLGLLSIAPISNEFELASGDDHCFCEITGFWDVNESGIRPGITVKRLVRNVENYTEISIKNEAERLGLAKASTLGHYRSLQLKEEQAKGMLGNVSDQINNS